MPLQRTRMAHLLTAQRVHVCRANVWRDLILRARTRRAYGNEPVMYTKQVENKNSYVRWQT